MTTFILVKLFHNDYSTIEGPTEFVFDFIDNNRKPDVANVVDRLMEVLDNATPEDRVVLNGPQWVVALAGFVWLSAPKRKTTQMLIFNNRDHRYEDLNQPIDVFVEEKDVQ